MSRVVKWALPGMQGQASAEKLDSNSPSNESFGEVKRSNSDSYLESYADFKFCVSEDTPSTMNRDTWKCLFRWKKWKQLWKQKKTQQREIGFQWTANSSEKWYAAMEEAT